MPAFTGLLDWPNCRNARDVGGLPTADGRRIRPGALIRTDSLVNLTPAGVAAVRAYGVRTILDVRSDNELDAQHPFAGDPAYRRLPFIDHDRDGERDRDSERTLADLYRGSINRNGRTVAALVTAIASAPPGGVAVHCHAGADRTGMLVALVLDTLGVDRDAIVRDYRRTHECLDAGPAEPTVVAAPASVPPPAVDDTMPRTLDHLDAGWGGSAGYLRANGVTEQTLAALADRLLTDRPR
jgi:protein-tyrosine phosphatase